jgi:hypothetical protein
MQWFYVMNLYIFYFVDFFQRMVSEIIKYNRIYWVSPPPKHMLSLHTRFVCECKFINCMLNFRTPVSVKCKPCLILKEHFLSTSSFNNHQYQFLGSQKGGKSQVLLLFFAHCWTCNLKFFHHFIVKLPAYTVLLESATQVRFCAYWNGVLSVHIVKFMCLSRGVHLQHAGTWCDNIIPPLVSSSSIHLPFSPHCAKYLQGRIWCTFKEMLFFFLIA